MEITVSFAETTIYIVIEKGPSENHLFFPHITLVSFNLLLGTQTRPVGDDLNLSEHQENPAVLYSEVICQTEQAFLYCLSAFPSTSQKTTNQRGRWDGFYTVLGPYIADSLTNRWSVTRECRSCDMPLTAPVQRFSQLLEDSSVLGQIWEFQCYTAGLNELSVDLGTRIHYIHAQAYTLMHRHTHSYI